MKKVFIVVMAASMMACTAQSDEPTDAVAKNVEIAEFNGLITKGNGLIMDVRTPEEYAEGAIEGAVNMNFYDADFGKQLEQLDRLQPVYVYCKAGGRSASAMEQMNEMGFAEVYNLVGGYDAWCEAQE